MEPLRKKLGAAVAGGVLLLSGAAGAYALTGAAGAQDTTSTTTATQDSSTSATASSDQAAPPANGQAPQGQPPQGGGQHQANGVTETILTGTDLEKVTAAAEAAVPGGTIDRAETDAEGAAFEAHVTKSDGSKVTVKLDSSYKVTSVEDGMR